MRGVCVQVGPVGVPRAAVQVVIFLDHTLELGLYVCQLGRRETVLGDWDAMAPKVLQESKFLGHQKEQGLPFALRSPRCSAHPVDVLLGLVGRVELHDPIDLGNVEASGGDVGAKQNALVRSTEAVIRRAARRLLLLAMNACHGHVHVIQQLVMELYGITGREKHHHLFVPVPFQKREQQEEAVRCGADHVALCQARNSGHVVPRLDLDEDGLRQ
mmetsp:Transcript_13716/g.37044  ORF Transcript_13716/g.37044 Transcript_13716/m.37044 type:complete len:215 (-) Transcript_13716:1293-1937(-)